MVGLSCSDAPTGGWGSFHGGGSGGLAARVPAGRVAEGTLLAASCTLNPATPETTAAFGIFAILYFHIHTCGYHERNSSFLFRDRLLEHMQRDIKFNPHTYTDIPTKARRRKYRNQ